MTPVMLSMSKGLFVQAASENQGWKGPEEYLFTSLFMNQRTGTPAQPAQTLMAIPWTSKRHAGLIKGLGRGVRKGREEGTSDKEKHILLLHPPPLDHTCVAS